MYSVGPKSPAENWPLNIKFLSYRTRATLFTKNKVRESKHTIRVNLLFCINLKILDTQWASYVVKRELNYDKHVASFM